MVLLHDSAEAVKYYPRNEPVAPGYEILAVSVTELNKN